MHLPDQLKASQQKLPTLEAHGIHNTNLRAQDLAVLVQRIALQHLRSGYSSENYTRLCQ